MQILCRCRRICQNAIGLNKSCVDLIPYFLTGVQKLQVSITLSVDIRNIRERIVICIVQEQIKLVISCQV